MDCDHVRPSAERSTIKAVWKAGRLETCTSGLGLGRGVKFPRLHHCSLLIRLAALFPRFETISGEVCS